MNTQLQLPNMRRKGDAEFVVISAQLEAELAQMEESESAELLEDLGLSEPGLDRVIRGRLWFIGITDLLYRRAERVPSVDRCSWRHRA